MLNSHDIARTQTTCMLAKEVERRRSQRDRICQAVNDLVRRQRGVDDFTGRSDQWMPPEEVLHLVLARQIATVSLENLSAHLLGSWINKQFPARTETVTFVRDTWAANAYKQSLTTIPMLTCIRDGLASLRSIKVIPKTERTTVSAAQLLNGIPARLQRSKWGIDFQGTLPDLHKLLRCRANMDGNDAFDISDFWMSCAQASSQPPPLIYAERGGRAVPMTLNGRAIDGYWRPPASWYYLLYLCLFVTGDRALIATTIEEDDESIRNLFLRNIALIEECTGFPPLIVWLPHYSQHLKRPGGAPLNFTEVNPAVFQQGWQEELTMPDPHISCYDAMDHLIHAVASLPSPS